MKTVSIEIPAPPDGCEVFLNPGTSTLSCEYRLNELRNDWERVDDGRSMSYILARRKPTLADWANEQPDFQALARMRKRWPCAIRFDGELWIWDHLPGTCNPYMRLPFPHTVNVGDSLKIEGEKWVDA